MIFRPWFMVMPTTCLYFENAMAPRTRTRITKVLKENIDLIGKTKVKSDSKVAKAPRKALADKTNSLSDDNASIDVPIKSSKVALKNKAANTVTDNRARPRRDRRLPNRYVENKILSNLSNNKDDTPKNQASVISVPEPSPVKALCKNEKAKVEEHNTVTRLRRNGRQQPAKEPPTTMKSETPTKENKNVSSSPFKTPSQSLNSSLVTNRPKRICRLPSKFEDHSVSPNKFIPVQPCYASTPLLQKNPKHEKPKINDENKIKLSPEKRVTRKNKNNVKEESKNSKGIDHYFSKRANSSNDTSKSLKIKISPDNNNNKGKKILPKKVVSNKSPKKQRSPKANIKVGFAKRLLENSISFRVFDDRKTENQDDVYEFTYDPNEEPKPQKKKRKRVVQKKPAKPKTVVFKSNYDKNVQKALESLKSKVKPSQSQNAQIKPTQPETQVLKAQTQSALQQNLPTVAKNAGKIQIIEDIVMKPTAENKSLNYTPAHPVNESAKSVHMSNYASIHIEDIAADFANDTNDLNYSPVNSPCPKTPRNEIENAINHGYVVVNPKDPLNLQRSTGNVSFFDEEPVASSSMMSVRNPLASPWRVEFNNLPIKWQADTYLKADMTPAVECSFINSEEIIKKKHVYTNLVAEEPLPLIEDPPLKQTSIISFMKEVAERSLKKKRSRSISPTKSNSLFEDTAGDTSKEFGYKTPKKPRKGPAIVSNTSNDKSSDKSPEKESSNHIDNHENFNEVSNETSNPEENSNHSEKTPTIRSKKKNKDVTLFGFDDSENIDQENSSPIKNVQHTRVRGLRAKSRVLREINTLSGPTRAILPVTAKAKLASSEVVEKLYDQMKAADDAPLFPEKQKNCDENAANDEESSDEDGQSVHLFEDIELVHHIKPHRKSYGKAKKVTFRQRSTDSETYTEMPGSRSSDEDDLGDLTFHMPNVKQKVTKKKKKKPNKKQFSKKEEKEADEWAAGFNSMCEDVEEFTLVVE